MKITHIVVQLVKEGTDRVYIHTDLPSPYPPAVSSEPLDLMFNVQAGHGVEYVRRNFQGYKLFLLDPNATPMKSQIPNPFRGD